MKLRCQLLERSSGALPAGCQLPDGYDCTVTSGRTCCGSCGGRLRRVRSSTQRPIGLMLGRPRVRLIQQQCTVCGQADPLECYERIVPPAGNDAYDLIVEVGLACFRDHRQDEEIRGHLLAHPQAVAELDAPASRRFVASVLLRWLDDYKADLQGEYFPFDLPSLAFYHRGRQLEEMLRRIVTSANFPRRELSTLKTIAGHLAPLREDAEVVAAACRLEKSSSLFEELRRLLRLSRDPRGGLLRGRGGPEDAAVTEQMPSRLASWRERLQQRHDRERDADRRADQAVVLKYLKKYASQLVGHVIELPGQSKPFVAFRTNNPAEHRFKALKQGVRRKVGLKKLTRQVQALRGEALLVANLGEAEYVRIVLNGSLSNLACELSRQWARSQRIRKDRLAERPEAPIPITKKELRAPSLLKTLDETVSKIVETLNKKTRAA